LLNDNGIQHTYREYTADPLSESELRDVFAKLGMTPRELLRKRDASKAGLSGDETDEDLICLMAENPRLLQRPIGVVGDKAAVGRPVENLLGLI
jgi:arsenate reductase